MLYMKMHVFPYITNLDTTLHSDIISICNSKKFKLNTCFNFLEIDTGNNILLVSWTDDFGYLFELCDYDYKAIDSIQKETYRYLLMYVKKMLLSK